VKDRLPPELPGLPTVSHLRGKPSMPVPQAFPAILPTFPYPPPAQGGRIISSPASNRRAARARTHSKAVLARGRLFVLRRPCNGWPCGPPSLRGPVVERECVDPDFVDRPDRRGQLAASLDRAVS